MVKAFVLRLLKLVAISVVCSITIYFGQAEMLSADLVLTISIVAFIFAECVETYKFSHKFWKIQDYFLGQLIPGIFYIGLAYLVCFTCPPRIFNRIFLPLRFANCFGMHTMESIAIVGSAFVVLMALVRFFAARAGRVHFKNFGGEDVK